VRFPYERGIVGAVCIAKGRDISRFRDQEIAGIHDIPIARKRCRGRGTVRKTVQTPTKSRVETLPRVAK